jgi:outer membrane protein assembly factor BamA
MIWKLWKKSKLNSETIWKIQKKSKLNSDKIWKIQKKIVKRYEKYGRKVG